MLLPITDRTVTRIVTDSNAMLPAALRARFDVLEVPLTIVIDGRAHSEHEVDLAEFYDCLRGGKPMSTSAPSPGEILAVYREAIEAGADAILSVHVGSDQSATVSAAAIAAQECAVEVTIVDTHSASFIEGCCVWRAAEELAATGDVARAAAAAAQVAASAGSVFTIGEISRAVEGGRISVDEGSGVPLLTTSGADMQEVARVTSEDEAVSLMTAHVAAHDGPLRVGVGHADAPSAADRLEDVLRALPQVSELLRYVVGPSVAVHTGTGTFGAVFHPI